MLLSDIQTSHGAQDDPDKRRRRGGFLLASLGALFGAVSVLSYSGPGQADMPPNPFSPEYGSILHVWLGLFVMAFAILLGAALRCRGLMCALSLGLLLIVCAASFAPAVHFVRYEVRR